MFELLTDKLSKIFKGLGGKGRLSEKDIDEALKQVRLALLEADVNFKVVKSFVAQVRETSYCLRGAGESDPGSADYQDSQRGAYHRHRRRTESASTCSPSTHRNHAYRASRFR